jgi:predicted transcriptional regulator with HTH domain
MQMAGQQFNMGQIIYILSNKTQSVVPAVVDEQVVRKVRRSDGIHEVISYKLSIGPKERQQSVDLSKIDGEVFSSLEAVKATLLERLTGFIDELVRTTQKNVMNWYGIDSENQFNQEFDNGTKLDPAF